MPTISVFYGIIIMMHLRDKEHNPPHVHAFYGNEEASVIIETGEIYEGYLPLRAKKMVKEFVSKHEKELLNMWETGHYTKIQGLD